MEIDCPFTPAALKKIVYAGTQSASFAQAAKDFQVLAEIKVTPKRLERWTKRVGAERLAEVQQRSEQYQQLPLPARQQSPVDQVPQVACVMVDGGRIQIRDRHQKTPPEQSHWKETLVGCCLKMTSEQHPEDPSPAIPRTFVDPGRMHDLSRDIKGFSGDREAELEAEDSPADRSSRPTVLVKSVVATRAGQQDFGRRLVAEAYHRGFHAAPRKAFVADGAASNWSIHRQHFSHYTPIVDFTHAICYVYAAAMAGRGTSGWGDYVQWAQWLWEGDLETLIEAVAMRSAQLDPPGQEDTTSPAAVVARTLVYLQNQQARMKYAEYRRLGLPITSSHIESTIKQINRRVKGTEKFWHRGAEPLLQLAADQLSETHDFQQFWERRQQKLARCRCYQTAA